MKLTRREPNQTWRGLGGLILTGVLVLLATPGAWAQAPATRPSITGIFPSSGPQGTTVDVIVTGTNLNVVRSGVGSTSISLDGSGIGLTFLPGRTDNRLPLRLVIAPNAPAGPRTITVRPPGSTSSAEWANATFTVLQAAAGPPTPRARPIISRIDPVAVGQGATTTITITGTNLKEPPGVAGDTNITLDGRGIRFFTEEHSATRIRLRLEIPANAPTGRRIVTVTPPGGSSQDQATAAFAVVPPSQLAAAVTPGLMTAQLSIVEPDKPICAGLNPVRYAGTIRISSRWQPAPGLRYLVYRELFDGQRPSGDQPLADVTSRIQIENTLTRSRIFDTPGRHAIRVEVHGMTETGLPIGLALASHEVAATVLDCRHQITDFSTSPAALREGQELQVRVGVRNAGSYAIFVGREAGGRDLTLHDRTISPSEWGDITETVRIPYRQLKNVLSGGSPGGTAHLTLAARHVYLGTDPERQTKTRQSAVTLLWPPPRNLRIAPDTFPAGLLANATITGENLGLVTVATSNPAVEAELRPGFNLTSVPIRLAVQPTAPAGTHRLTVTAFGGTATVDFRVVRQTRIELRAADKCDQRSGAFNVPILGTVAKAVAGDAGHMEYFKNVTLRNGWRVDAVRFKVTGGRTPGSLDLEIVPPTAPIQPGAPAFDPSSMFGVRIRMDSGIDAYLEESPQRGSFNPLVRVRWWVNLSGLTGHADCQYEVNVTIVGPEGTSIH